jgi:hypothetical protein
MRDNSGFHLRQSFCITLEKKFMKQFNYSFVLLFLLSTMLTSCELVEGVFKAGFYSAFIIIIVVVGLIIWLVTRFRR